MPTFPQINANMIITQLPYAETMAYETIIQEVETGMRYTFPKRASGLDDFPTEPLGKFAVNFPSITDNEADALQSFFRARRGRYGKFRFLNPGGNLVQYSEDFTQSYWDKSTGPITVGGAVTDPFGGALARSLSAGAGNSALKGVIGSADGGLSGYRMTVSVWVNARDSGTTLFLGFSDSGSTTFGTNWELPYNTWKRISHSVTLWSDDEFRVVMGGSGTWSGSRQIYIYGFQCVPMKGEGAYVRTPGNYGYLENCRFDTDKFERRVLGPNQNSISLPIAEFFL